MAVTFVRWRSRVVRVSGQAAIEQIGTSRCGPAALRQCEAFAGCEDAEARPALAEGEVYLRLGELDDARDAFSGAPAFFDVGDPAATIAQLSLRHPHSKTR